MTRQPSARPRHGPIHLAVEDPDVPGCCGTCGRPIAAKNDRHQLPPADPDQLAAERARLGEHDQEDT